MWFESAVRCFVLALVAVVILAAIYEPEKFGLWLQKIDTARYSYPAYDQDRGPSLD